MDEKIVTVEMDVVQDGGAEYILPSLEDLDRDEALVESTFQEAERLQESGADDSSISGEQLHKSVRAMRKAIANSRKLRNAHIDRPEHRVYTMAVPSFWEWTVAENEAKLLNKDSGDVGVDQNKLMMKLFPASLRGLSEKDKKSLAPNIAKVLWDKLYAACWPDESRLPF